MIRDALAELRLHPGRFAAVLTAIALSVAFLTVTQVFVATEGDALATRQVLYASKADLVAKVGAVALGPAAAAPSTEPAPATPEQLAAENARIEQAGATQRAQEEEAIKADPRVAAVDRAYTTWAEIKIGTKVSPSELIVVPTNAVLRWFSADTGRLPTAASEIMISREVATAAGVGVGDSVILRGLGAEPVPLTIVGLIDESGFFSHPAYVSRALLDTIPARSAPSYDWIIKADSASDIPALKADLTTKLGAAAGQADAATVTTGAETRAEAINSMTRDFDVMSNMLLVFGAIALLVGAIIIANTFAILVAQRRRQIGLLRAVGASRNQVRRRFVAEALALGLIGSLLGLALGAGLAALVSTFYTHSIRYGFTLPWLRLGLTLAAGVLVTVLASLLPIRRAIKVAPLEALQPVADVGAARHLSVIRGVVCGLFVLGGAVLAWLALHGSSNHVLLAVASASLITIGVLFSSSLYVPALLRLVGLGVGRLGPTPRLAAANATRNPARAGATATALMLAVGLIMTLQVGAATMKATANTELDKSYPIDAVITPGWSQPVTGASTVVEFTQADLAKVRAVDGVAAATIVDTGSVQLASGDGGIIGDQAMGYTPAMAAVLPAPLSVSDTEILLPPRYEKQYQFKAGQQVAVTASDPVTGAATGTATGTQHLTIRFDPAASGNPIVSAATLKKLDPSAATSMILAKFADRNAAMQIRDELRAAVATTAPNASVDGGAMIKAMFGQVLDIILLVVTALLGVAALIALIGVGNTLGLSVVERTRESALLRALGLQSRGLRWMLLTEALLLALVGTAVGIAAGFFFGWLGSSALIREMNISRLVFAVNPWQLVAVVAVATVAGALASVLPGRRAAKATPVEALADLG